MSLLKTSAIFWVAVLLVACASYDGVAGRIPPQTQLSLSPNGTRLIISWHDGSRGLKAKLIALNGVEVESVKNLVLPEKTWTTEFSFDNKNLLITTLEKEGGSALLKFDVENGSQRIVYTSHGDLRFPLEIRPEEYAFLESIPNDRRLSQWRRLRSGENSLLDSRRYGLAAPLNITGDAIYVFEPSGMFRVLNGQLPAEVDAIASNNYFSFECSDSSPVFCFRDKLVDRGGQFYSVSEIVSKNTSCRLKNEWLDRRDVRISRNGKVVIFHAALTSLGGPRGLYVVDSHACSVQQITINGSER